MAAVEASSQAAIDSARMAMEQRVEAANSRVRERPGLAAGVRAHAAPHSLNSAGPTGGLANRGTHGSCNLCDQCRGARS